MPEEMRQGLSVRRVVEVKAPDRAALSMAIEKSVSRKIILGIALELKKSGEPDQIRSRSDQGILHATLYIAEGGAQAGGARLMNFAASARAPPGPHPQTLALASRCRSGAAAALSLSRFSLALSRLSITISPLAPVCLQF